LRTEELAQPGEGARAGVQQAAREDGNGARPSSDEGGAGMRQPARKARGEMVDRCFERCGSPSMRDFAAGADCDDESAQQVSMEMARPKMRAA
jgi:hypothetical protein